MVTSIITKKKVQNISNKICNYFVIPCILIVYKEITIRKKKMMGLYKGNEKRIEINPDYILDTVDTLLHELAHHLDRNRFLNRVEGYYKMEMWPKMEYARTDESGQKWYAATGKPHPIYIHLGRTHGKVFKKCLKEITEYYNNNLK